MPFPPPPWFGPKKELSPEEKQKIEVGSALFREALEGAIRAATQQVLATFRPARMGVGTGECAINANRDIFTASGFDPEGYSNHTATVLRFDGEDGTVHSVDLGVAKGLEITDFLGHEMAGDLAPILESGGLS